MARRLRIQFEGAIYHVTVRGVDRCDTFTDREDYERSLRRLGDVTEDCGVRLSLFCLMTNHFHLDVETPRANLSAFMHRLATAYTVYFNLRHKRHGHLMQGRFGATLVQGYDIESWGSTPGASAISDKYHLESLNATAHTVVLDRALPATYQPDTSGLIWPLGGMSDASHIWTEDAGDGAGNIQAYKVYLGHEIGHNACLWIDVSPVKNLMQGGFYGGKGDELPIEVRERPLPHFYRSKPDEHQWNKMPNR